MFKLGPLRCFMWICLMCLLRPYLRFVEMCYFMLPLDVQKRPAGLGPSFRHPPCILQERWLKIEISIGRSWAFSRATFRCRDRSLHLFVASISLLSSSWLQGLCSWTPEIQQPVFVSSILLLRGWLLRELVFRAQQVLTWAWEIVDISGYYANPFRALFLVVSDYNVVGAHLGARIWNFAPRISICTVLIPSVAEHAIVTLLKM